MKLVVNYVLPKLLEWAQREVPILASNAVQDIIDKIKEQRKMNKITIYVISAKENIPISANISYALNDHIIIAKTDKEGICNIENLPMGTYKFTAEAGGYIASDEKVI